MERTYTNMSYLNYAALKDLISAIKTGANAEKHGKALDMALTSLRDYVTEVDVGEQQMMLASVRFEGEEYREMMQRYDTSRRAAHEDAIAMTRMLNRLASMYQVNPIFTGNDQERLQIADFCLDIVIALFEYRSK